MTRLRTTFAALALRDFRLQWTASMLATAAFMTTFVLVPIVAYDLTGSYAASGFAAMGNGIAMLLLTPLGGVLADRLPKKPTVLIGQFTTCGIIAVTGVLIVADWITIPLLFASTLLSGASFALTGPARQSWVAELVPERLLPNAVALQQMAINIAQVLGPTVASVCVVAFNLNAGALYLGAALLFVIVVPLTFMLPWTQPVEQGGRSPLRELSDGFGYLRRSPRLRILWPFWLIIVVCGFSIQTLMPGILDQEFNRSSSEAVVINSIFGFAALAINLPLAGAVSGRLAWPMLFATALLMSIGLWLIAIAPTYALILILSAVAGAGRSGVMLVNQAIMMSNTRPQYFGRVMSFVLMAFGFQAMLGPVWGVIADAIGGRETLVVVGIVAAAATGLMLLAWLRVRRIPPEPGTAAAALPADAPPTPARPSEAPAFNPAFAARVALMDGQKAGSLGAGGA